MPKTEVAGARTPQELAPPQPAFPARLPVYPPRLLPILAPEETLCSCTSNVIDSYAPCIASRHFVAAAILLSLFHASRWQSHSAKLSTSRIVPPMACIDETSSRLPTTTCPLRAIVL